MCVCSVGVVVVEGESVDLDGCFVEGAREVGEAVGLSVGMWV